MGFVFQFCQFQRSDPNSFDDELASKKVEPKSHDLDGYYQFGHSRFDRISAHQPRIKELVEAFE